MARSPVRHLTLLAATALVPLGGGLAAQTPNPLVGDWLGRLNVGAASLRLALHVEDGESGPAATLVSLDQGAQEIPVESIGLDGATMTFGAPAIGASFEGTLAEDGQSIEGTFTQMGNAVPLTFERTDGAAATTRPQDPEEPLPYPAEDVSFPNPDGGHTLAGTLTTPEGDGPFPAVILISGSGPQDRNEALMGHRPFLVLSDHLTRSGLAVLRYDDRGVGESTGNFATATSRDFASDVLAAVAYLGTRPDVDPERVGLAGHSEGGLIAPMVAALTDDVSFLVLMAGPGVNGERILYAQSELIARAGGTPDDRIQLGREYAEKMYAILKSDRTPEEALPELLALAEEQVDLSTAEELEQLGINDQNRDQILTAQIAQLNSPWFRQFLTYEPSESLEKVRVPVLAINGEKDLQVPYEENLREIGAALERGGNDDFELHALPGLNHLFQTAETGHPGEYGQIEETWAVSAMELISSWILKTVKRPMS